MSGGAARRQDHRYTAGICRLLYSGVRSSGDSPFFFALYVSFGFSFQHD